MNSNHNQIGVTLTRHVDMISYLPDDVITNSILSLLPTKDSVRTSALSTRWKHLYTSVPVLDFNHSVPDIDSDPPFVSFVSNVINTVTNKLSHIPKFSVYLRHIGVPSSDLISWIETATSHSVEILEVHAYRVVGAPLPHCLFTCETLVSLSLDHRFLFSVPDKVCLPKLKNLWLRNLIFSDESDDESVMRLFSSCPVLEKLMVFSGNLYGVIVFNVSVPSLKNLGLHLWHSQIELVINCPNLEELSCECYAVEGYSGDVLGSLKKCDIEVGLRDNQFEEGKLIELVRQVCKVQYLSLDGDAMQALLFPPGSLPTFKNLTHLRLESGRPDGWQLLPSILDCCPRLKVLDFDNGFFDIYNEFGNPFPPPEHVPVCLSFHLKVIKIARFIGEEDEYKWVEYFLTNALVLENMEICLWSHDSSEEEDNSSFDGEGIGREQDQEQELEQEQVLEHEQEHGYEQDSSEEEDDLSVDGERVGVGDAHEQEQGHGQEQEQGKDEEEQGKEEEEEDGEGELHPDFERNFQISKRLLNFQRISEVCQIILTSSDY